MGTLIIAEGEAKRKRDEEKAAKKMEKKKNASANFVPFPRYL